MQEKMRMMWDLVAESQNVQCDKQGQEAELSLSCLIMEHLNVSYLLQLRSFLSKSHTLPAER